VFHLERPLRSLGRSTGLGITPARGRNVLYVVVFWRPDGRPPLARDLSVTRRLLDHLTVAGLSVSHGRAGPCTTSDIQAGPTACKAGAGPAFMTTDDDDHQAWLASRSPPATTNTLGPPRHRTYQGQYLPASRDGFHDHSWELRTEAAAGSLWIVSVFRYLVSIMAMPLLATRPLAPMRGYIPRGRLRRWSATADGYSMRDDCGAPAGCDSRLFDEDGRVFRLLGRPRPSFRNLPRRASSSPTPS